MERKKILVLPSDKSGCGYFRSYAPHKFMSDNYGDDFIVDIDYNVMNAGYIEAYFADYDLVHFHKIIDKDCTIIKTLKKMGIKTVIDLDDYWKLGQYHPLNNTSINEKWGESIVNHIKLADYVTTTTPLFANEIKKFNKNVEVIPNAIDNTVSQFIPKPVQSNKLRIGIICGSSHLHDIKLLENAIKQLSKETLSKIQFVLCGFDTRGSKTYINPVTGEKTVKEILPQESVWCEYEKILTNNYQTISPEFKNYLLKYQNIPTTMDFSNEPYQRCWTKDISEYATHYNNIDVLLAPLVESDFNKHKCIVGDSLVSTTNGILKISDIVNNKLNLFTEINGNLNNVVNYFKYEDVKTIKIITEDGYEIEGTPNHKIYINNEWVELQNLKEGNYIELNKPEFLQKNYQEITYPMLLTKNITEDKIKNADDEMIPRIRINENWGRLLGYLLGDGNYNGTGISISCDKRHTEVVDDVINLYKSIGLNPLVCDKKPDKRCKNILSKEGFGVDIKTTCVNFLSISKKYGWCGSHGKTFRVPSVILESPKTVIKEFLKGLFEADGSVSNHASVSLCSKDLTLIKQVQILLLGFNIQSTIRYSYNKHYKRYYYVLNLRREGSEIFKKEIGFVSKQKNEKLNNLINTKRSNYFKKQTMTNKISKIEYNINTVYDIEIENVHSYNANGIINHNSQLKAVESGFFNKVIIAQNFGPYTIDLINAINRGGEINPDGNALLVDSIKNHKQWAKYIEKLVDNPELITLISNNLNKLITEKYSLENVTKKRVELYKKILKDEE